MLRAFRQVDVFGEQPFTGNPVAVVLDASGLSTDQMCRFSVWSNLSECTFVQPAATDGADYRVRIFSLATELPFAGHPTLGTARAWLDAGNDPQTPGVLIQECGAGLIPVRIEGEVLSFAAPDRIRSGPVGPDTLAGTLDVLGVEPSEVLDAEWLDNGPGWVGVLLSSHQRLSALKPDASRHPGRWDLGVMALRPSPGAALELRAFFTDANGGLREDPVTGSLNAAAAQWLLGTGRLTAPYRAVQGTALGRSGRIEITQDPHGIWVGGRTDISVIGSVNL